MMVEKDLVVQNLDDKYFTTIIVYVIMRAYAENKNFLWGGTKYE